MSGLPWVDPVLSQGVPPVLRLEHVGKQFGATPVLHDVDCAVAAGETLGLIGPNGAGKTTLFNIVTGFVTPSSGRVLLGARDLAGQDPAARARLGLVRTFQKSLTFAALSVRRNLALAALAHAGDGYRWWGGRAALRRAEAQADALLADLPLAVRANVPVADLSYGEQRIVDILIALAQAPRILLLDEPTAGLSTAESEQVLALVRERRGDAAVVLIAHDLDVVFRECDRVAVLDLGRLIALGTPQAVRDDPAVHAAYLGGLPEAA
ncbi:ABC transporter ATP-binding protein [Achromobacter sp. GG226]|uniref:ABC transporter ATP-binding protein n=1 Tax=Verticiella alkaliphila TaxID=2779529 RepID=UPI001C0E256F|nr:ABC transporter ATP-binding protein [Verticiella sp. GG226]MBU4612314.1 ABC transporter ATP-binding protein [Verticiella sp. GG226]